jgi:ribosome recycling factor
MTINDVLQQAEQKMKTSVEVLKKELATIRTGHASPGLVENIRVDYAGMPTPLNQIARITAPEARLLVIQPWDKSNLHSIEKAILKSDLGINPSTDGNVIRLNIPQLTEERRQEIVKIVRKRVEEDKVAIRNVRHDAVNRLRDLEKSKEISQDDSKRAQTQLQKLTDAVSAEADQIGRSKETEITKF